MKEIPSTLTSKGQVTIPAEVRRHLGLKQGDTLTFVIEDKGRVALKVPKYSSVASLAGAAGTLQEPADWKEVRDSAREARLDRKYPPKG